MAKKFTGKTEHKHILMLLMERLGDETLATTLVDIGAVGGTLTWSPTKEPGIVQYEVELDIDESDEEKDGK